MGANSTGAPFLHLCLLLLSDGLPRCCVGDLGSVLCTLELGHDVSFGAPDHGATEVPDCFLQHSDGRFAYRGRVLSVR
jgi:hypothetical protein